MTRRLAILILSATAVCTLGAGWLASGLRLDYDFEDFFPQDDPATDYYNSFRRSFETDNDFFLVAVERSEGVFDPGFLRMVDSLGKRLSRLPDVEWCMGPTDLTDVRIDPVFGGVFREPLLHPGDPSALPADSALIWETPGLVGSFFASDGRSVMISLRHTQQLSKSRCDELSRAIEETVGQFPFERTHLIGRALGQRVYVEMMVRELAQFIALGLLLTVIFLYVAFRSGWGVVIPTLIVLLALLWTLGFMRIIGKDIDPMLTILPTIIFVVGVSDSVHVLTKYMQEIRKGKERLAAIRDAFRSIRLATFLTALTTSVGFLSLVFSNIRPISDFGVYSAAGIMLAYGLTYSVLPAILFLSPPGRMHAFALSEDFWSRRLHRALAWIIRRRRWILGGGVALIGISLWGISRIHVDNFMLEDLKDSHFLKQEFRYMEEHYAGCRPFEMGIRLPDGLDPFDPEVMRQMEQLDHYLLEVYGVGNLLSPSFLAARANRALHAGMSEGDRVPDNPGDMRRVRALLQRGEALKGWRLTWSDSLRTIRYSGKVADIGRMHYEEGNRGLSEFIQRHCPLLREHHVTGTAHLIDLNNRYLVENLVWDLLLSVAVIGLIMGLVYQSWKMIPLTILPNMLPILIVAGIMGFTGIPLKVSTSIIFNIAFGIAVDDTIHFLARVRTLLASGLSREYAVKRTFLTTGKAMIVTTLILSAGFLSLVFSDFLGSYYIGLLISMTLFIALVIELLYTPLVVWVFYRPRPRLSIGSRRHSP